MPDKKEAPERTKSKMSAKKKVILTLVVLGLFGGAWLAYATKQLRESNEIWERAEEREGKMQW